MSYNQRLHPPPLPITMPGYNRAQSTKHPYIVIWEQKGIFPLHDYSGFMKELRAQEPWMHYFGNVWLLMRIETLTELASKLRSLLKKEDYLLVMPAVRPVDGQLPQDAWNWLAQNLPQLLGNY